MKRVGHIWIVLLLITLAAGSGNALAWDWLTFYPTEVEAIVRFTGIDRSSDINDNASLDTEWRAGVRISQSGYSLDPGIARFLLQLEPMYAWGKYDSTFVVEDRNTNLLNYLVQLNLLNGTPGPFAYDLSALHSSNLLTGSLGSRTDNQIDKKSAAMRWKNDAFPMSLVYEENTLIQDFVSGQNNARSRRDDKLQILSLTGRSSKMDMLVERQSLDDRVLERNNDYDLTMANLNHRLIWGNNSQLRSRFNYFDRTGFNANRRETIEENLHINHSGSIFSNSMYRYFSVTQEIKTTEHLGEFRLVHRLYNNLTTEAAMRANTISSDLLDETRWRTGLETQYAKQDFFGLGVNAGLGFYYEETDRESSLGLTDIVDEPHVAPLGGAIILNRRFIVIPTIIVTDADGVLVYSEGIDYIVLSQPEDLTQLQTIPGGRIQVGDTLLVSYKAQVLPSQKFSTTYTRFNLGIDLGWMRLSHFSRKFDDKLLAGAGESFLNDNEDRVTELEFRWNMGGLETTLGAERRYSKIRDFESDNYTFRQLFSWAATARTLWHLSLLQSFTDTTTFDTDLYNIELSVNWQPLMGLSIRPVVAAWRRKDTGETITGGLRDDEFITAGFTLRWLYRKVALDLAYHYNRRAIDGANTDGSIRPLNQTNEHRLMFNLSRKF